MSDPKQRSVSKEDSTSKEKPSLPIAKTGHTLLYKSLFLMLRWQLTHLSKGWSLSLESWSESCIRDQTEEEELRDRCTIYTIVQVSIRGHSRTEIDRGACGRPPERCADCPKTSNPRQCISVALVRSGPLI